MSVAMTWRLAQSGDVPVINQIAAKSIRALHQGHYEESVINSSIRYAYGVDWQLIRDGTYFIIEEKGAIIGAGGWSYRATIAGAHGPDEPAAVRLDPEQDAARIRAFYIDPDFARRGAGALLLRLSEDAARNAGFKRAELTSTLPAIPFYSALGYRSIRAFDLPLPDGVTLPLELMEKSLGQFGG